MLCMGTPFMSLYLPSGTSSLLHTFGVRDPTNDFGGHLCSWLLAPAISSKRDDLHALASINRIQYSVLAPNFPHPRVTKIFADFFFF